MDSRAQAESIGVVLLTGAVIVAVAGVGTAILANQGAGPAGGGGGTLVDIRVEVTPLSLSVTHAGGDSLALADASIIVRGETTDVTYPIDPANVSGDGDGRFEPGERFRRSHDLTDDAVTVLLVDAEAKAVVDRVSVDVRVPDGNRPPTAAFDVSPPSLDPGENGTFDASSASDPDGSITNYTWTFGDGTTATGETVTHSYDASGSYNVELTVTDDSGATDTVTETVEVTTARAPDDPADVVQGLTAAYYEGSYTSLPDFDAETPRRVDRRDTFDITDRDRDDDFAFRFTGYVEVPERGNYTFYTKSDDGSRLFVGDQLVVDNGGLHPATEESGEIELQAGRHAITVTYFEHTGGETLDVRWAGPNVSKQSIPATNLSRDTTPLAAFDTDCAVLDCSFAANGTATGDDSITSYEWAFGDGTTATGETVSHEYDSGGTYTADLTVVDDAGDETTVVRNVTVEEPRPASDPSDTTAGVAYSYYENATVDDLGDLRTSAIVRNGTTDGIDLDPDHREENFGFRYTGYVTVPETGEYTFHTTSDDGSRLFVGSERVVNNDGEHSATTESGSIALEAGTHPITVTYFEHEVDQALSVEYEGPGVNHQEIPTANLSQDRERVRWATASDWDGAVDQASVVHDDFGDHAADRVDLGTARVDRGGSNLAAYWPMDEDGGTTATDVAGSNDGTLEGDVTPGETGIAGTSGYDYGGTDGRVLVPDDASLPKGDAVSVSLWVKTTNLSGDAQTLLFAQNDFDAAEGVAVLDDGQYTDRVVFRVLGDGTYYDVSVPRSEVNDGSWHHLAGSHGPTETVLYLDGRAVDSRTDATFDASNVDLGIGAGAYGYGPLQGELDEVRLYDRALTESDVQRLYGAGRQGTLTTGTKTLDHAVSPSDLALENVSATRPAGTAVTVTVQSDPDGDGTFEETGDPITLDGSGDYDVAGLASDSRRYRLAIELSTTDPTASPTVESLELAG